MTAHEFTSEQRPVFAHEIIDMWVPDARHLRSRSLAAAVRKAAELGGLKVLKISAHQFTPGGFTIFALLSQSHVALHTWPEREYVACDIFSCGGELDRVVRDLVGAVAPGAIYQRTIARGEPTRCGGSTLFLDQTGPGIRTLYDVNLVARYDSEFQHADVYRHAKFGGMLVINDDVQFCESDHQLYDDSLMAPLKTGKGRKDVLVIGGGDGLCATYLLSRNIASSVKILELDPLVPSICQRHFPKLSKGLIDPRTNLVFGDAVETITQLPTESADAVVVDTTAPDTAHGHATYGRGFLEQVGRVLRPGGQLCMNGTSVWFEYEVSSDEVQKNLRRVFSDTKRTTSWIPSFGSPWSFFHATKPWR
jgi:spermidine synthase